MANMMYDIMKTMPPRGSIKEALMIAVRKRRDLQDIYRTFALIQAARDKGESGELTQEAFESYRTSMLPYLQIESRKADDDVVKRLQEEVQRGPLVVRQVMETPKIRSRLQSIARKTAKLGAMGR